MGNGQGINMNLEKGKVKQKLLYSRLLDFGGVSVIPTKVPFLGDEGCLE